MDSVTPAPDPDALVQSAAVLDLTTAGPHSGAGVRLEYSLSERVSEAFATRSDGQRLLLVAFHAFLRRYTREGAPTVGFVDATTARAVITQTPRSASSCSELAEVLEAEVSRARAGVPGQDFRYEVTSGSEAVSSPAPGVLLSVGILRNSQEPPRLSAWVDPAHIAEPAAERLLEHLGHLLSDILLRPDAPIRELALMSEEERVRVARDFADGGERAAHRGSIVERFRDVVERTPDAPAVEADARTLSYFELDRSSDRIAASLRARGIETGAVVGVAMDRSAALITALLGILKAGAAYLPLNRAYPDARVAFMLEDTQCSLVVADPGGQRQLAALDHSATLLSFDALTAEAGPSSTAIAEGSGPGQDDLAYVIYTSGSTGRPKGVRALHRGVVRLVLAQSYISVEPGDRVMGFAPTSFDASTFEIWGPLLNGGTLVLAPSGLLSIAELGRFIGTAKIDTCWLTAALFHQMVDSDVERLQPLKYLLAGGDVLSPSHVRRTLEACPGLTIVNGYGPTENTTFTTCHRMASADDVGATVPIGRPIAGTTVHVVDADDRYVPIGVPGELLAGGRGVADGYHDRSELTAERFVASPPGHRVAYRTGDLVRWLPDGTLEFLGRIDDQVKVDGYRIELGEVEARLAEHPELLRAVVRVLDRDGFRRLVAYVVASSTGEPDPAAIRAFCAEALPRYMVPASIVVLPELPVTANGKVDRATLPDPTEPIGDPIESSGTVSKDFEGYLVDLWSRLLGRETFGLDDGFFDLGGTSLLSLRVLEHVRADHGIEVPVAKFYQFATVRSLAGWMATMSASGTPRRQPSGAGEDRPSRRGRGAVSGPGGDDRIAIIGMAGRFPGASDVDALWEMLAAGRDGRVEYSDEELRAAGVPEDRISDPDYVKASYPLQGALEFEPAFFGMLPREVELMDPQQRLFLELAWTALEHAGYDPQGVPGRVGVYGGVGRNSYLINNLVTRPELADTLAEHPGLVGNLNDFPTTHVSFRLGFDGPSIDVQTACSTSGVAVHMAANGLLTGETDVALAGGCKILVPNRVGYMYTEGGALSERGRIRAFDAGADGMVRGSGGAMLVLKRLEDAVADGDNILGVMLGSAVNNDGGDRAGFATPSPAGQARVIATALDVAGVDADSIDYVEAHGTGTILGDPIEVEGLTLAYRRTTDRRAYCGLGSIKSSIGHLDAGATAAGIVKTLLAFANEEIPATLNVAAHNPHIDFDASPFFINRARRAWPRGERPRRAGVSSFGLGGTNAHLVLEEPPLRPSVAREETAQTLVLSARTPAALERMTAELADRLEVRRDLALSDVARTLQTGRHRFAHRRTVAVESCEEAVELLRSLDRRRVTTGEAAAGPRVAFLFPGQGAQHPGMGQGLYASEPVYRDAVDRCAKILQPILGLDLRDMIHADPGSDEAATALRRTAVTQPALFVHQYAMCRLLAAWGIEAEASIGHSIGEYAAATLAGVFELEDALRVVAVRGQLMQELPPGSMAAVPLPEADLGPLLPDDVTIAAVNTRDVCVISGPTASIERFVASLAESGHESRPVATSHAFHSAMMEPMVDRLRAAVAAADLRRPTGRFVSTVTGDWIAPEQAVDPEYWASQVLRPVRFAAAVETLVADDTWLLLDTGPGRTAASLSRRAPGLSASHAIAAARHPEQEVGDRLHLLDAVGRLWSCGVEADWTAVDGDRPARRVPLPTYPYERVHLEIAPASTTPQPGTAPTLDAPIGPRFDSPQPAPVVPTSPSRPRFERIVDELRTVFFELSGIEPAQLDLDATFIELGFDSLFLAQANGALKKRFRTSVGVRRLLDSTPSISSLAAWLDGALAGDFFPVEAPPASTAAAAPVTSPAMGPAAAASGLEGLIQAQIGLLQQQLALVAGQGLAQPQIPTTTAPAGPTTAGPLRSADPPPSSGARDASAPSGDTKERAHGPWRPLDRSRRDMSDRQRHAIADLIGRVEARTAGSKAFMARHRRTLADARSVVGFRSEWKELVYQIVAEEARGGRITDVDGHDYVDVVGSFGVNFFGHSPDFVTDAVRRQLEAGFAIGPQTALAGEVAELVSELTGMERVSFCNTGSEAVLAALRIARTVTGNDRIAMFSGHYHGVFDEVLVKAVDVAGSRTNFPLAPGIPSHAVEPNLVLDYGDPAALDAIRAHAGELACVIMEPVRSRNPALQPVDFVRKLRELTRELRIPFIFDEMVTGFRAHPGGAQALFGVEADIATYGKVVGAGYPIGVVAGRAEFMDTLDGGHWEFGDDSVPEADMTWVAGTFVRHPLSLAAAKAALEHMKAHGPGLQTDLAERTTRWVDDMNTWFEAHDVPIEFESFTSLFLPTYTCFQQYSDLFPYYLLTRGVFARETRPLFWSIAHTDEEWDRVTRAYRESALEMQAAGLMTGRDGEYLDTVAEADVDAIPGRRIRLTEPQREVWVATRFGSEASVAFNLGMRLEIRGTLDVPAMRRSLQALVDRHEALRATFDDVGEEQTIHPALELDIPVVDLSDGEASAADIFEHEEISTAFDLLEGPLVRARILDLGEDRWRVLLVIHHIVADGWAFGILSRELGERYSAEREARTPELRPVLHFSEYVRHLDSDEEREERALAEHFWRDEFKTLPPPLDLPSDRPRPALKTYAAGRVGLTIGSPTIAKVRESAQKSGATLFAFAFAAFEAYLARITGQSDVVVGFDLAGQALVPGKDLVCHAVSFLPLRAEVDGGAPFSKLVAEVRGKMFDVIEHQRLTYGTLLRIIERRPDPSRPPLISVSFNLDPSSLGLSLTGLEVTSTSIPRTHESNDLFINLVEQPDGAVELQCTYNCGLFDAETVERRMREYVGLLEAAAENPSAVVNDLPLVVEEDHELLERWNSTAVEHPRISTLHGMVEAQAARTPDRIAVRSPEAGVAHELTWAELDRRANALASRLQASGVGRDVPVVVSMERSVELVVALLGVLKAGGAYVPVDPGDPADRRAFMVGDCGAPIVLSQSGLDLATPQGVEVIAVDALWDDLDADDRPVGEVAEDALAYVIYTSGSTGRPKGVMVEHAAIVNRIRWMQDYFDLDAEDVVLQKTPYSFDVSVWEFFWPLSVGARLVMVGPEGHKDTAYLSRVIRDEEVTTLHFVPSMLQAFLEEPTVASLDSPRRVICSGEALGPALRDRFFERTSGAGLWNLYGPTEAAVDVSVHRCEPGGPDWTVPIGRPIANTRLHVLDDRQRPVPIGTPGELYIGGVQVARGYLGRDDLTDERFVTVAKVDTGRIYRTGDLVRWNVDGELEFLGRLDHQVKIRGFRIELGEIEVALEALDGVRQAVVMAREVAGGELSLVAYVTGSATEDPSELARELGRALPEYMLPTYWVALDDIPTTPSGKVDRRELPLPARRSGNGDFEAPSGPTEAQLAEIWKEVLDLERVGRDESFFDLGGHSILATRVVARVRSTFEIELPLRSVFAAPTLRRLAEEIDVVRAAFELASGAENTDDEEFVF